MASRRRLRWFWSSSCVQVRSIEFDSKFRWCDLELGDAAAAQELLRRKTVSASSSVNVRKGRSADGSPGGRAGRTAMRRPDYAGWTCDGRARYPGRGLVVSATSAGEANGLTGAAVRPRGTVCAHHAEWHPKTETHSSRSGGPRPTAPASDNPSTAQASVNAGAAGAAAST